MRSVLIVLNTFAERKCLNHAVPEWRQDPGWVDLLLIMDMHSAVVWRQDSGCFGSFACQYAACGVVREGSLVFVLTLSCCTEGTYCEECVVIRLCRHVHVRN